MDEQSPSNRRRRGAGLITQTACTECRKKRAKCDGLMPACSRCQSNPDIECIYEPHIRQSKDDMRAEIESLKQTQRQNQMILEALTTNTTSSAEILMRLRKGEPIESITQRLEALEDEASSSTKYRNHTDQQAIGGALSVVRSIEDASMSPLTSSETGSSAPASRHYSDSSGSHFMPGRKTSDVEQIDSPSKRLRGDFDFETSRAARPLIGTRDKHSGLGSPSVTVGDFREQGQEAILGPNTLSRSVMHWTEVTNSSAFINHLMTLYFCWEYPTFASLNKEHFLEDYRSGTTRYCSSVLVNAILALGCRFSSHAEARVDPSDSNTAGDHFFAECVRLLALERDKHALTTIQALGLMGLREASCGRTSESYYYAGQSVRLAIEGGLHKDTQSDSSRVAEIDHEVRSATFWGAFSLDQAWALSIGRLPQFSSDLNLVRKPALIKHIEASSWVPYTDDGAPLDRPCTQPSNVRSVFKSFAELSEAIHGALYTLYTPGVAVTSKGILEVYNKFLHWYEGLTTALRLGENFTPAVLFAHMHYQYSILLLFRPFLKLNIIGSSVSPRDVCAQASDAISALVKSYHQLYTLRRTPSFVPYFVLNASIAHMATMASSRAGPEQLRQGLEDLKEMSKCHVIASKALDILRYLVIHWEVKGLQEDEADELRDIKTMCRPRSNSLNQFCPHIERPDVSNSLKPHDDDSPLFWPFPLQGRPLLDVLQLEACGFELANEWKIYSTIPVIDSKDDGMDMS